MDNVSNRQVKERGKTKINPRFPLPPGVIDVEHGTETRFYTTPIDSGDEVGDFSDDGSTIIVDIGGTDSPGDPDATDTVYPPDMVTVMGQTVRVLADGSHVVDVVIDVTDATGIIDYDVRLSKA